MHLWKLGCDLFSELKWNIYSVLCHFSINHCHKKTILKLFKKKWNLITLLLFNTGINIAKFHFNFRVRCVAPWSGGVAMVSTEVLVTWGRAADPTGEDRGDLVGLYAVPALTLSPWLCGGVPSNVFSPFLSV